MTLKYAPLIFAVGTIGFGLAGLAFGDFAVVSRLVPQDLPWRLPLSIATNLLLVSGGAMLVWRRTALWGAMLLAGFYTLWAVCLPGPRVAANPGNVGAWLAFSEILAFAIGAAALALLSAARTRETMVMAVRIAFGACALIFGLSHFVYLDITADFVPDWIPQPYFWAMATGAGHLAAGASLVAGPLARLAAPTLAFMMGSFALLVHVPRVIASPAIHFEWSMLFISLSLTGAAWLIRTAIAPRPDVA